MNPLPPDPLTPIAVSVRLPWPLRVLVAVALVFALREAKTLLLPVAVAVVLTFVLAPAVRWLRRRGVPEVLGAALLLLMLLAAVVPVAASLAEPAAQWWEKAPTTLAQLLDRLDRVRAAVPGLAPPARPAPRPAPAQAAPPRAPTVVQAAAEAAASAAISATVAAVPPPADPVKDRLASESVAFTGVLLERGLAFALSAAVTLILLYFLLASEHWILSRCVEAIPRRRSRALLLGGVRAAQREIGSFLFALGCINLGLGVIAGWTLWMLGLDNPMLWGALVAVLNFVPYLGPAVIFVLLLLAGIVSFAELPQMLAPAGAFTVLHAVESNLFSPWLVGRRLSLSPISVFLSVMFWGWLWGVAGALIAVPMLIAMRSVCRRHRRLRAWSRFLEGDSATVPALRALLRHKGRLRQRTPRQPRPG